MGEIKLRTCDILGRRETEAKPVCKVRLLVEIKQEDKVWLPCFTTGPQDMCPAAIERAIKFAKRGASPPNIAATQAAEATATDGKAPGDA